MRKLVVAAAALGLAGCAGMLHNPDIKAPLSRLSAEKICAMNVLDTSMLDPVAIETCASPTAAAALVTRFGTMHEDTAHPSNWTIRIVGPTGKTIIDNSALEGTTAMGACGTGGCSKEGIVTTTLPGPWAKGKYRISYASKKEPVLKAEASITVE